VPSKSLPGVILKRAITLLEKSQAQTPPAVGRNDTNTGSAQAARIPAREDSPQTMTEVSTKQRMDKGLMGPFADHQ